MSEGRFNELNYMDIQEHILVNSDNREKNKYSFPKSELTNTLLSKCDICPRTNISESDRYSFYKQNYLTVKTKEEVILYRVTSEKEYTDEEGKIHKGRFASPDKPFDRLSAKTDLALSYPFGNRMEVVEEIKVPVGEILQVGYVAPKTTNGKEITYPISEHGNILRGMSIQVILPERWHEKDKWEILNRYPLESRSKYCQWETLIESRTNNFKDYRVKKLLNTKN